MSCPFCGCDRHAAPKTWATRCVMCRLWRWPYQMDQPDPATWVCPRCQATPPELREERQARGRKARLTRLQDAGALLGGGAGTCPGSTDAALADPPESDTRRYDARTGSRRGGRPQVHATRRGAQAAASRAYRTRQRAGGAA